MFWFGWSNAQLTWHVSLHSLLAFTCAQNCSVTSTDGGAVVGASTDSESLLIAHCPNQIKILNPLSPTILLTQGD